MWFPSAGSDLPKIQVTTNISVTRGAGKMTARQPAGRRRYGARILLHREPPLDLGYDLLGRFFDAYRDRRLGFFQVRQLAGENRVTGKMSLAGVQAIGDQSSASLQVNQPNLRSNTEFCAIGALESGTCQYHVFSRIDPACNG